MNGGKYIKYVPGVPVKRHNPCVDPQQNPIEHIERLIIVDGDNVRYGELQANADDYPEWAFIIQQFIDNNLKGDEK